MMSLTMNRSMRIETGGWEEKNIGLGGKEIDETLAWVSKDI